MSDSKCSCAETGLLLDFDHRQYQRIEDHVLRALPHATGRMYFKLQSVQGMVQVE